MNNDFITLLVNPPIPFLISNKEYKLPPALLYLAGYLRRAGENVEVLDLNIYKPWESNPERPEEECYNILLKKIIEIKPSLIGFGCLFSGNFSAVLKLSEVVKEQFPTLRIVIGGMHPTIYASEILTYCPSIDYIVLGEGETQLLSVVKCFKNGGFDISKIRNGFAFRVEGKVIVQPHTEYIDNLDDIPFPAYDIVNFEPYKSDLSCWHNPKGLHFNMTVPLITSRSCPYKCNFCSMFLVMGTKFRSRSAQNVVDEIELLYNKYHMKHFNIMDDNFTLNKKRTMEICNEICRRNINIEFETLNGVMLYKLDKDIIDAMVSTGWVRGALSIESGSDYIRNEIMGKRLSREKIYKTVELCRSHPSLYLKACFIIGMPEDTQETLMDTYKMTKELDVHEVLVANIIPFPGTSVFYQCLRDNLFIKLDLKNLWKDSSLYCHPANKRFFIKPYNLEMEGLQHFREKFDRLADLKRNKTLLRSALLTEIQNV